MNKTLKLSLFTLMIGLFSTAAFAQDTCNVLVNRALETLNANCASVERNQACYGYDRVDATFVEEASADVFTQPSDIADLALFSALQTAPFDETSDEWGVALMKIQANLPGTLPGQNVMMVVMGDAKVESAVEGEGAPMEAFYFTTGVGQARCADAPDTLILQSPANTTVNLTINESEITLASTAILSVVDEGAAFELTMADGEAMIDGRMMVREGHWAKIPLDVDNPLENGFHGVTDELPDCRPTPQENIAMFEGMMEVMPKDLMNYEVDPIDYHPFGCEMMG